MGIQEANPLTHILATDSGTQSGHVRLSVGRGPFLASYDLPPRVACVRSPHQWAARWLVVPYSLVTTENRN